MSNSLELATAQNTGALARSRAGELGRIMFQQCFMFQVFAQLKHKMKHLPMAAYLAMRRVDPASY
jgi:hypothetical protein